MTDVDLSIIIPCHNEAATLPYQLDGLAGQVWDGDWEVIVVDNASTDGTAHIARSHGGLGSRLRVVEANQRRGVSYTRRMGVEASTARSVAFCDGDDVVGDAWVAVIGDSLRTHSLVTGEILVDRLNDPGFAMSRGRRRVGEPPMHAGVVFLRGNNGAMWRTVWDRLGGFDESFVGLEDIELSLRAASIGLTVHFAPAAIVHYRYRSTLKGLWKQGLFYGRSYPKLRVTAQRLGLATQPQGRAWKSWLWLAVNAPALVRAERRPRWVWTAACRVGAVQAGLRRRGTDG